MINGDLSTITATTTTTSNSKIAELIWTRKKIPNIHFFWPTRKRFFYF